MSVIQSKKKTKKKTGNNTTTTEIKKKITDHSHDKCITIPEFIKLTAEIFIATLA